MNTSITISTVTPVYQGEKYLHELVSTLQELKDRWEISDSGLTLIESIFVCDSPVDDSIKVLNKLKNDHPWIQVITLSMNFGQHAATTAGISHSSGDWVITLDEDLQHHPKYIERLLAACASTSEDICYAKPTSSVHRSVARDALAFWYKRMVGYLIGNPNVRHFNSFRCIRGSVARAVAAVSSPDTYFDVVVGWFTNKIVYDDIDLIDLRNQSGEVKSGYSIKSLIRHGQRMLLTEKIKILRVIILLGSVSFLFSLLFSLYVIYKIYFLQDPADQVRGWPSTIISIYFFGGLTCLILGMIVENTSDMIRRMRGRPAYFVVDRSSDDMLREILKL